LKIVDLSEKREFDIISSDYVKFELEKISDTLRRKDAKGFEMALSKGSVSSSKKLLLLSKKFVLTCRLGALDALHLAAACIGAVDFFLTCDDEILNHAVSIERLGLDEGYKLKVRNPINYVKERRSGKKCQQLK
jgi:hypothetical protein